MLKKYYLLDGSMWSCDNDERDTDLTIQWVKADEAEAEIKKLYDAGMDQAGNILELEAELARYKTASKVNNWMLDDHEEIAESRIDEVKTLRNHLKTAMGLLDDVSMFPNRDWSEMRNDLIEDTK